MLAVFMCVELYTFDVMILRVFVICDLPYGRSAGKQLNIMKHARNELRFWRVTVMGKSENSQTTLFNFSLFLMYITLRPADRVES